MRPPDPQFVARRHGLQPSNTRPERELPRISSASSYNRLFSSDAFDSRAMYGVAPAQPHFNICGANRPEPLLVYFIYSFLLGFAALALTPYWLVQGLRRGKYFSNLFERLGFSYPTLRQAPNRQGAILLHGLAVGEVLSGISLARRLKEAYPERLLVISTTTITGHALARERMPFADAVIYFPLDWAFCVRRVLNAIKPSLVIILETEIWPNFLRQARRRNIPVLFVSGRISDRSFLRYQKYLGAFGFFLRPFLNPPPRPPQQVLDAKRKRRRTHPLSGRTCRSCASQRQSKIRSGPSCSYRCFELVGVRGGAERTHSRDCGGQRGGHGRTAGAHRLRNIAR